MCIEEDRNSPALLYCGPLVEGGNCVHRSRVLRFTGIVDFLKKVCTSPSRKPLLLTYAQGQCAAPYGPTAISETNFKTNS